MPLSLPIASLLKPRSIALVGVSAKGGGAGASILKSGARFWFTVPTWPVNPNSSEIDGHRCYKSLRELPAVPDCVVISLPADAVFDVVSEAAAAGIRGAYVVSEGFADAANDEGRARQARLVALARSSGMAIAGPNCMGLASLHYRFAATMADIPAQAQSGGISVVSQSGGLLNSIAELITNRGIGANYLISSGNEAVLEMADYIEFLADDPATKVIACIIEGAKDGRRFRAAVERAARIKPLVVLKLGRSAFGQRATLAHTGTLAGSHEAFAALCRQNGVALADSIDALVETASLLERAPLPKGDRVVMMTVSGGATSLIGDLGEAAGINFPPIGEPTNGAIQKILGVNRAFGNPLDTVGLPRLRKDGNIKAVIDAMVADDGLDVIGLVLAMRGDGMASHQELIDAFADAAPRAGKPLLVVAFTSNSLTKHWRDYARTHALPIVENLERGLKAVRHLIDYAKFRSKPQLSSRPSAKRESRDPSGQLDSGEDGSQFSLGSAGMTRESKRVLTEAESKKVLANAGLPVTREALARDPAEAVRLAADIGGPVALKIQSPDIPHKSDIGGVHLGARGAAEVEAAARKVFENAARNCPGATIDGILVQEMVEDGVEFILGMTYDETFGPMVVCGAGGVTVEVFKDAGVLLPPFTREDVADMLRGLKSFKLLGAFRGARARDVEALIDCCVRFGDFAAATAGQFAAIDLNPVFVCAQGVRIADALIETKGAKE